MTPGAGRHRAADDADEPADYPSAPPFAAAGYLPPPPFVAPPVQHAPLLEHALQQGQRGAPPTGPPPPLFGPPDPHFIPLRPPRRSQRSVGTLLAALLILALVVTGGYVFLTRSGTDSGAGAAAPLTISLPSATASARPVARTETRPVHLPVQYRSVKGHFIARFAHRPAVETLPGHTNNFHFVIRRAIDTQDGALVQSVDFPDIPVAAYGGVLDGSVDALPASSISAGVKTSVTTFRHHPARRITLTGTGGMTFTGVVTMYPGTRMYLLLARSGTPFRALEKSFATLP